MQESEDEWWARVDKRIERVRARQELAHLGMGTFFLVYTAANSNKFSLLQ